MNVAVTGGLGFIGSRLAERYAHAGHAVSVLDNLHEQVHSGDRERKRVERFARVIIGDVRSARDWDALLAGSDLVLHMAAETGTGQSMSDVVRYCDVNVTGTAQLAEALERHESVRRVFLPSSRAIYGEGAYRCATHGLVVPHSRSKRALEHGEFAPACPHCGLPATAVPTSESTQPSPSSVYASTKASQEQLLRLACENARRELRVARYQNVYGPGQSLNNPYTGVLAIFSQQIAEGKTLDIYEDGNIARDFVYVDDVVAATMRVIETPDNPGPVNIGTGRASNLFDIVRAFEAAFGRTISYEVTGHFRYGDIRYAVADTTLALSLGIRNDTDLPAGIAELTEWVGASAVSAT